jgi:hypothetical protein
MNLFMEIDLLGNYTSSNWFSELTDRPLNHLHRYYIQMWNYRAGLSEETKRLLSPLGSPFYFNTNTTVKESCVYFMENLVFSSPDIEIRKLGALHVLAGLTQVSHHARYSLFWLYEST